MENSNEKKPLDNQAEGVKKAQNTTPDTGDDVLIYDSSSRRPLRARRDVQPSSVASTASDNAEENDKTRVDMPTITEEIITPDNGKKKDATAPPKPQRVLLEEEEEIVESEGRKAFSALGKSLIYIACVLCASIIIAYMGITVANDLFAFVKDDAEVTIVVDEDTTFRSLASDLEKAGVIRYPLFLRIYNSFQNNKNQDLEPDTYKIKANLNYDEIISTFTKKAPVRTTVRITFPEGLRADEMIDIFLENGIGTREDFEKALSSALLYDMDYRFLKELQEKEKEGFSEGRAWVLEGYLYPDTYDFYTDTTEINAIAKLLSTFNVRFEEAYYERCDELGYTVDEIVNIASLVQMEAKHDSEYAVVSSVYHNRLDNPTSYPRLECDSTYLYVYPERRDSLTLDEMRTSNNPYSTYSHDGLTPSAICSPSLNALIAALYPSGADDSGNVYTYYYMYARPDGYHEFASTLSQHQRNMEKVAAMKGEE